jgi:hypothetical protein
MHIDNLLKQLPAELFETIRPGTEKQHLAIHLSMHKADRRLISDDRGNWRLADQQGGPADIGAPSETPDDWLMFPSVELAMRDPAKAKETLAAIDAVLDYVRQDLRRLDEMRRVLEFLRRGLAGEPR